MVSPNKLLYTFFVLLSTILYFTFAEDEVNNDIRIRFDNLQTDREMFYTATPGMTHVRYVEWGKPAWNIGYVGRGYDLVYGNPKETTVGGDKGYRQPVFKLDTSEELPNNDWRYVHPADVQVFSRVSCQTSITSKVVTSSIDISKDISESITEETEIGLSIQYDDSETKKDENGEDMKDDDDQDVIGKSTKAGLDLSFKFGNSESFKEEAGSVDNSENSLVISEADCSVYEARLNPFKYPPFTDAFLTAVDTLPATYDENSRATYMEFIATYGTHAVTSVLMGARYGRVYTLDSSSTRQFENKSEERKKWLTADASLSASKDEDASDEDADKWSFNAGASFNREESDSNTVSKEEMLSQLASDEKLFSIGAPYNPDPNEWAAESEKDPFPIHLSTHSLADLIATHIDPTKGSNLNIALSEYRPPGAISVRTDFGKCYIETVRHVNFATYNRKTSLVARCKPGFTAMGGTFSHLWNVHGDIKVDALESSAEKLMGDLQEFHKVESQQREVEYILKHGSDMLKSFTDGRALDHLTELFGERVDPSMVSKFLTGKLNSLSLEKDKFLGSINNGLQVFGKTELGKLAAEKIQQNPYAGSIFKVGKSLMERLMQAKSQDVNAQTLSIDASSESTTMDAQTKQLVADYAHTLVAVFDAIDAQRGVAKTEEAKSLIIGDLINFGTQIFSSFTKSGSTGSFITDELKKWKNFTGKLDNIWGLFEKELAESKKQIVSTELYQQLLDKAQASVHGATLLETRNSLSWMFPYRQNSFVCGSGNVGVKPTAHSSMGYCSAFCCAADDWKMETKITHRKETNLEERTSTIVAACPGGYSVVSGGFLISGHEEGRFLQVVTNRAEGNSAWKCTVKWTEESYNPLEPRFQCYARCGRSIASSINCVNAQTPLVNGHGTAYCDASMMAMSGGWEVQSEGVTYFKKTELTDIHPVEGPRGHRCELSTAHGIITGSCFARCCDISAEGTEIQVVEESRSCPHYFSLTHIQPNGDLSYVSYHHYVRPKEEGEALHFSETSRMAGLNTGYAFGAVSVTPENNEVMTAHGPSLRSVGSTLSYDKVLKADQVLTSRNGNYFARFNAPKRRLEIFEEFSCDQPHRLTVIDMDPEYRCGKIILDAREKALRQFFSDLIAEDRRKFEDSARELSRINIWVRFAKGWWTPSYKPIYRSYWGYNLHNDWMWRLFSHNHLFLSTLMSHGGIDGIVAKMSMGRTPALRIDRNGLGITLLESGEECSTVEVRQDIVSRIEIMDTGDLAVFDDEGNALRSYQASACRLYYRKKGYTKETLHSGEMMFLGDGLISRNKQYLLVFTRAGDLAVVRQEMSNYCSRPEVKWANVELPKSAQTDPNNVRVDPAWTALMQRSEDANVEGWILRLQEDNNLVILDDHSNLVFETKTAGEGHGKAELRLTDEGKLSLVDAVGITIWDPEYGKIKTCQPLEDRLKIHSHRMGVGSGISPGLGGLISRNKEYILFIEKAKDGNHLEMWRSGGDDCKPVRICTLRKNIQELSIKMNGLWDGDLKVFSFDNGMPITEITLSDSGHFWVHGGREHRREVSKQLKLECSAVSEQEVFDNTPCRPTPWNPGNTNWNLCAESQLLSGWDQTDVSTVDNIKSGQCCDSPVKLTCRNVDWRNSFVSAGNWIKCPNGEIMQGIFTENKNLNGMVFGKCCGPTNAADAVKSPTCYEEDVSKTLDTSGRKVCKQEGYYLSGLRRESCNELHCVDRFLCCQLHPRK